MEVVKIRKTMHCVMMHDRDLSITWLCGVMILRSDNMAINNFSIIRSYEVNVASLCGAMILCS